MFGRAILSWFVLAAIGIANGVLRGVTYGRFMSDQRAHQLSTFTGVVALFSGAHLMMRGSAGGARDRVLLAVGAGWALATVAFEFSFGRLVAKESWENLLHAYDLRAGQLWSAIPATIFVAPLLIKRLASRQRDSEERRA
jgi:hypothetical protein